jgi:hypothetical protein
VRIVQLLILNRSGCPHRRWPDPEGGWGPQVPTCHHPHQRSDRDADYWCPDKADCRDDDPTPRDTPFPPGCPLREGETITRPR